MEMEKETNGTQKKPHPSYVAGNSKDADYFGAKKVVADEVKFINGKRGTERPIEEMTGLALSGGGIRSASFSLGVLQALAYRKWLCNIDYLSTVSGGGYIGSSLTWLLSKKWKLNENETDVIHFNTSPAHFPYATYPMSGNPFDDEGRIALDIRLKQEPMRNKVRGRFLRYLRQNAKYLTPGSGINIFSMVAVLLRGIALGLITYFGLLVLCFLAFNKAHLYDPISLPLGIQCNAFCVLSLIGVALYAVSLPVYSLGTFGFRQSRTLSYKLRRIYEKCTGILLPAILAFLILGSVPWVIQYLPRALESVYAAITGRTINVSSDAFAIPSMIIGIASGIAAFMKTSQIKPGKIPLGLLVGLASAASLFGMLIYAYQVSCNISGWIVLPVVIVVLILSWVVNVNHVSVHRYYRDRLMETFMPDVAAVLTGDDQRSCKTREANEQLLHEICENPDSRGPYHIINTNMVCLSSQKAKLRGRGGDNFILSPLYCGSNATGWLGTKEYMDGALTFASAMAISGAAVNPDTGCGGEGITRQPLLSILMGILNVRLGYWVPNPNPAESRVMFKPKVPNYLWPGLWSIILRYRVNERAYYLQLSDGGHFENLALYELIRRRLKLIIVCDGAADQNATFADLANVVEKVRTDFGALIMIKDEDLKDMMPSQEIGQVRVSPKGFLMADIVYANNIKGRLIYINTTFCEGLSADLYGYKKQNPSFPEEPTSDQFFDEKQFEAYRELGYQIALNITRDDAVKSDRVVQDIMPVT